MATTPWNSLTGLCLDLAVGPGDPQDRGSIYFLIPGVSTPGEGKPREKGCAGGMAWGAPGGQTLVLLHWDGPWDGGSPQIPAHGTEPPCLGGSSWMVAESSVNPMGGEGSAWHCAVGPQESGGKADKEAVTEISSLPGISHLQSSSSPGR